MHRRSNVSPVIEFRARQHRSALTESEALLWAHIRACRLGVWFRRQVPRGNCGDVHAALALIRAGLE